MLLGMSKSFHRSDVQELLAFIRACADEIEKAVIHPPGAVIFTGGSHAKDPDGGFIMVLHFADGEPSVYVQEFAEILLNSGVLSEMNIKIEFQKIP